ncbi:hypothetical protein SCHPADRAFT_994301 [Schizopora paradoxa]|uniref:F-box domain-containing protein n=1 Tax=Schizopora paradoxa TaxID=27342 RepID=A0A0H2RZG0_9AGAM|nr:hypothetical protein SCHPADRAFT_994301 [Schizopora paradoxa]
METRGESGLDDGGTPSELTIISTSPSVAQNLPEDLLYPIILKTLPSSLNLYSPTDENPCKFEMGMVSPLKYSFVCRSWRALVLSRPKLWSEINIFVRVLSGKNYSYNEIARLRRGIEKWLFHSSPSPLQISFYISGDIHRCILGELLPPLTSECHRWSSFYGNLAYYETPEVETPTTIPCSPNVTSFTLRSVDEHTARASVDFTTSPRGAESRLEYFNVNGDTLLLLPPCRDALHFPRLRSLSYIGRYLSEPNQLGNVMWIVSASVNLNELTIAIQGQLSLALTSQRDLVHLPHLSSLTLRVSNRHSANYLLQVLECPSLLSFIFKVPMINREEIHDLATIEPHRIHNFILQSTRGLSHPLKKLMLYFREYDKSEVPEYVTTLKNLLVSLKNLEMLGLQENVLDIATIEMLTIPAAGSLEPPVCPSLSGLTLSHTCYAWGDSKLPQEAIEKLVISRWKAGCLRTVALYFPYHLAGKGEEIKKCVGEGLVIMRADFGGF